MNAYRLSEADEDKMSRAIRRKVIEWRQERQKTIDICNGVVSLTDRNELARAACAAIGCTPFDLRESELLWIENEIGEHALCLHALGMASWDAGYRAGRRDTLR